MRGLGLEGGRIAVRRIALLALVASVLVACGSADGDGAESPSPGRPDQETTVVTQGPPAATTVVTQGPTAETMVESPGGTETTADDEPGETTTTTVGSPPSTLEGTRTTAEATEDDPVPVGEVVELPGLWELTVTGVDFDAADEVLEFADINPAPEDGFQYVLITIEGVYLGDLVAQPAFEWAVSDGDVEYLPSVPGCGVIPDSIYDVTDVLPGEKFLANICVPVAESSVSQGMSLFLQPLGDEPRYFELD